MTYSYSSYYFFRYNIFVINSATCSLKILSITSVHIIFLVGVLRVLENWTDPTSESVCILETDERTYIPHIMAWIC